MLEKKLEFPFSETQKILKIIAEIDRFKGKWEYAEARESQYLKELRKIATIQSIGSSTRIEGANLSDGEVEKLLKNIKITKFSSRDEAEVVGYYEVLELILESFQDIKIEERFVLQLHGILLKHSEKDQKHKGKYKSLPNSVTATYPDGSTRTIFKTTPPHLVNKEIESLLSWFQNQIERNEIHPLLIFSVFIYEFLSIHPFQDGNGRLSRLLTTLLLLKHEYGFVQYISFEHQIEQKKKDYYQALITCQKRRSIGKAEKIFEWVNYFLGGLLELVVKLDKRYEARKNTGSYINDRQKSILEFMKEKVPVKLFDLKKRFSKINENTIKKDLQYLVKENYLERIGEKKGSNYIIKNGTTGRSNG